MKITRAEKIMLSKLDEKADEEGWYEFSIRSGDLVTIQRLRGRRKIEVFRKAGSNHARVKIRRK